MSNIAEELVQATGVAIEEDVQASLQKLVQAINDLDDAGWTALSSDAQSWFNDAAKVVQAGHGDDLPSIPGMIIEDSPMNEAKDKTEGEPEEKPEEKQKTAKPPKKAKREGPPVTAVVRSILCENADQSFKDLWALLEEREIHVTKSTAQVVFLTFQKTLEAIRDSGGVKNNDGEIVLKYKD